MPRQKSRYDLNKLGSKNPPYFLFFVLSVTFIALSLLAYNYAIAKLSTQLVIYNTSNLKPTSVEVVTPMPTQTPEPTLDISPTSAPKNTPSPKSQITPTITLTPTPAEPYLKTYQNDDLKFKVQYLSTRTIFEDHTSTTNRFVFVKPEGNFVVHVGKNDWTWVHSGRELTSKFTVLGKPTFIFDTTSQKLIDIKSDSGLFFTIQCVHNGVEDLKTECSEFIKSLAFL